MMLDSRFRGNDRWRGKENSFGGRNGGGTTEDKLVLGIPLVVRLRPIVVQPQLVRIAFHVEDARIAIRVGLYGVPSLPLPAQP